MKLSKIVSLTIAFVLLATSVPHAISGSADAGKWVNLYVDGEVRVFMILDERVGTGGTEYLLLAKEIVDSHRYSSNDKVRESTTWETSGARSYLNGEWLQTLNSGWVAATSQELTDAAAGFKDFHWFNDNTSPYSVTPVETVVQTADNPWYKVSGGDDTKDQVFLLALEEVLKYADVIGKSVEASPELKKANVPALPAREKPSITKYDKYESKLVYRKPMDVHKFYAKKSKLTAVVNMPVNAQVRWTAKYRPSFRKPIHSAIASRQSIKEKTVTDKDPVTGKRIKTTIQRTIEKAYPWMLRTPGDYRYGNGKGKNIVVVEASGRINLKGKNIGSDADCGLRPAFWATLDTQ